MSRKSIQFLFRAKKISLTYPAMRRQLRYSESYRRSIPTPFGPNEFKTAFHVTFTVQWSIRSLSQLFETLFLSHHILSIKPISSAVMNISLDLSPEQTATYLQTLPAIRERCSRVYDQALLGKLGYFDYSSDKETNVVDFCIDIMKVRRWVDNRTMLMAIFNSGTLVQISAPYGCFFSYHCTLLILESPLRQIPPHGRWRHLDAGRDRVSPLTTQWKEAGVPELEQTKRLIDLILVSVLLDAGAGNVWTYKEDSGNKFSRSEGLAVASFDAFVGGFFSGEVNQPFRVDGELSSSNPTLEPLFTYP